MMKTYEILAENLDGNRNPNSFNILWNNETLPCGTTWSTGYDTYEIIPFEWGFQLIKSNGRIAPPTKINFGKLETESDFYGAFERAMNFVKKNCQSNQVLKNYLLGI